MADVQVTPRRRIIVTGATGKQGGAVLKALLEYRLPFDYELLALTRKASSPSAIELASKPHVSVIEGDLNDCNDVFVKAGGSGSVWGVFSIQVPGKSRNPEDSSEVKQGCALIDASIKFGVQHFVQTSVDRGGEESDKNPTDIPHFITKHIIEQHLKDKTAGGNMTYTILRPVAFMDMLQPNMLGSVFAAMWAGMGDKKLQLVSTKDIGIFAAQAFASSETDEYKNGAISLAGDELTQAEANDIFWKALHRPMPRSYGIFGSLVQWLIPEVGTMFKWFVDVGYGANITKCRMLNSGMLDLAGYLDQESKYTRS